MKIEYVPLTDANLADVHGLCVRAMPKDALPLDWFRHKTLGDPDFDPCLALVAMSGEEVCGFMMGVCRRNDDSIAAGIKIFAVDEKWRGRKIASGLLDQIESGMKSRGATKCNVGFTRPNYITGGLDAREYTEAAAFLIRRGYTNGGDTFNMDVDLSESDWQTAELEANLAERGITCRRLGADEKEKLWKYMKDNGHSEGWAYQVRRAAEQDPIGVFIALQGDDIVGFSCYDGVRPGWFGPMGTKADIRGGGLGTVTYLKCLQSMKELGYAVCEVNCVGPLYFYSKTSNAKVSRICWSFSKQFGE